MKKENFQGRLAHPADPGNDPGWAFVVLPKDVSAKLPRRGRTTVECALDDQRFQVTLEPDGNLSHWLRVPGHVLRASGAVIDTTVSIEIVPVAEEPEPPLPPDFRDALATSPDALVVWTDTTTLARVDWIHWIESAKQAKTRAKRIQEACDKLASGQRRVCCFDSSGYYSKALCAPRAAD